MLNNSPFCETCLVSTLLSETSEHDESVLIESCAAHVDELRGCKEALAVDETLDAGDVSHILNITAKDAQRGIGNDIRNLGYDEAAFVIRALQGCGQSIASGRCLNSVPLAPPITK